MKTDNIVLLKPFLFVYLKLFKKTSQIQSSRDFYNETALYQRNRGIWYKWLKIREGINLMYQDINIKNIDNNSHSIGMCALSHNILLQIGSRTYSNEPNNSV